METILTGHDGREPVQLDKIGEKKYEVEEVLYKKVDTDMNYRHQYVWERVVVHIILQTGWIIGIYTAIFHAMWPTILWTSIIGFGSAQSIALGAHRGYSHKSFKATKPLQIALLFFQTIAGQNSMFTWVRDHKLHHKYSDTDADPHNATRGFFFSHMGWLMVKRHPLLKEKEKQVDVSDLLADKYLMFQYKYFLQIYFFVAVVFPISVPMYFWNETFWNAFFVSYFLQYVTVLHITWSINSFAHLWGNRPYDKRIQAVQSWFTWLVTGGEGWHNFHHAFPWDSRLSEYGQFGGVSTTVLDLLTYFGLAYDLKTVQPNIVFGHMKRHGDVSGKKILDETAKDHVS